MTGPRAARFDLPLREATSKAPFTLGGVEPLKAGLDG